MLMYKTQHSTRLSHSVVDVMNQTQLTITIASEIFDNILQFNALHS